MPRLTAPDNEFWQLEAWHYFGYSGWLKWFGEDPFVRGRLVAHLKEKHAREAYEFEARTPVAPKTDTPAEAAKPAGGGSSWELFKSRHLGRPAPAAQSAG